MAYCSDHSVADLDFVWAGTVYLNLRGEAASGLKVVDRTGEQRPNDHDLTIAAVRNKKVLTCSGSACLDRKSALFLGIE